MCAHTRCICVFARKVSTRLTFTRACVARALSFVRARSPSRVPFVAPGSRWTRALSPRGTAWWTRATWAKASSSYRPAPQHPVSNTAPLNRSLPCCAALEHTPLPLHHATPPPHDGGRRPPRSRRSLSLSLALALSLSYLSLSPYLFAYLPTSLPTPPTTTIPLLSQTPVWSTRASKLEQSQRPTGPNRPLQTC